MTHIEASDDSKLNNDDDDVKKQTKIACYQIIFENHKTYSHVAGRQASEVKQAGERNLIRALQL